jgi:outer membrane lipoprotein SlyB
VNGRDESIAANGESVVAGSTRARNLGAIAGGAVAGALIGDVVGDGRNATVGALIGGAAATGVVAGSKGYQVVLRSGMLLGFTVD